MFLILRSIELWYLWFFHQHAHSLSLLTFHCVILLLSTVSIVLINKIGCLHLSMPSILFQALCQRLSQPFDIWIIIVSAISVWMVCKTVKTAFQLSLWFTYISYFFIKSTFKHQIESVNWHKHTSLFILCRIFVHFPCTCIFVSSNAHRICCHCHRSVLFTSPTSWCFWIFWLILFFV